VRLCVSILAAGMLTVPNLQGQSKPISTFAVASIKPNRSPDPHGYMGPGYGGRFTAVNTTMRALIRVAYGLQDFQIAGEPNWVDSDRFDVMAIAGSDSTDFSSMLRILLGDRLKLRVHKEPREHAIFALVMARSDRRLGKSLHKSQTDCSVVMNEALRLNQPLPPVNVCGARNPPGQLMAGGMTMSGLAVQLSRTLNRIVVDRTGLSGGFDFDLQWSPDQGLSEPSGASVPAEGPSIFTALQEQLGLKLEPKRGPVDVLVIDHVERPTPD
jgi:uncharacterized protein (TIGR03435 family)